MLSWAVLITTLVSIAGVQSYSYYDDLDQDIGPVIYANIAYRHGYRTPIRAIQGLPLSYAALYPQGYGQLTLEGMRSQYGLGLWLRDRYRHLIPTSGLFNPVIINVTSCSLDRTVMSAMCNLAGMFPAYHDNRWATALGHPLDEWMPIPLNTVPSDRDNFFHLPNKSCRKWAQEFDAFKGSDKYKEFVKPYSWVLDQSIAIFNSTFNYTDPIKLCNMLIGDMAFNLYDEDLPMTRLERRFLESLDACNMAYFRSSSYTDLMRRLVGGPLLKQMISNMETALVNERKMYYSPVPFQRLAMFSGKDLTLAPLLFTMGFNVDDYPKPSSAVLLELRQQNGTAYVTVMYKNTPDMAKQLYIPDCPDPCRFDTFKEIMKPFIPDDWERECNS